MSVTQTVFNFVPDISNTGSRAKEISLLASVLGLMSVYLLLKHRFL